MRRAASTPSRKPSLASDRPVHFRRENSPRLILSSSSRQFPEGGAERGVGQDDPAYQAQQVFAGLRNPWRPSMTPKPVAQIRGSKTGSPAVRLPDIGGQVTRAGAFSPVSIDAMFAMASRNENATPWAEAASVISAADSLTGDPQNPTNTRARGARRRMRLTRKRARAGELVLISDRHTTEASLNGGGWSVSADRASADRGAPRSTCCSRRSACTRSNAAASSRSLRPATQTTPSVRSGFGWAAPSGAEAVSSSSDRFWIMASIPVLKVARASGASTPRSLSAWALAKAGIATSSKNSTNE